jgi:cell division protein FtsA
MTRARGRDLIVGLDVGTTKVCAIIAEAGAAGALEILAVGTAASRGLRRGMVVNIDSTVEAIKQAMAEAELTAGVEVGAVYASVAGSHIRGVNSRGVVAVSGKDREVTAADVARAVEAARAIDLPPDREIVHVLPQTFVVDDQDGVRQPVGMTGVRLEVETHIVTGAMTSVQNLVRSVNRAGLTVQDIVFEPLASAESVLLPEEKELGVLLVDVGGGTTDVALYREGSVWHSAILPLGGDHITNDIAVGLRTAASDAEGLKRRYGCALTSLVAAEETVDVPSVGGRKARQLSRQILSEIIQPRVEEIFTLAARDLARAGFRDAATAGAVVTGGTSLLEGVSEVAERVFDLPVRRGAPQVGGALGETVASPIYATGVGLVLYGLARQAAAATAPPDVRGFRGRVRRLTGWFADMF